MRDVDHHAITILIGYVLPYESLSERQRHINVFTETFAYVFPVAVDRHTQLS